MRITTKILITTLPLVVLGLLGLGWMTTSLSQRALNQLAAKWLDTKLLEAIQTAENKFAVLIRYQLQDIPANVKKAQDVAAKASWKPTFPLLPTMRSKSWRVLSTAPPCNYQIWFAIWSGKSPNANVQKKS
jgi:hypothetical protein